MVDIPDVVLREAVARRLGKERDDPITRGELSTLHHLIANGVRDLTGLSHAVNLTQLRSVGGEISDLMPLKGLTSLTGLYLDANAISDISPLSGLASLTELYLSRNVISDLRPLASLTSLRELNLHSNGNILDVSPLASLTVLTTLYLGANVISDVAPLAELASLDTLWLEQNAIADASPLAGLGSLETLLLHQNAVADASAFAGLERLTTLTLGANAISDASPLAGLKRLTWLDLSGNAISDVSPLAGLMRLTTLFLGGNPISDVSPLARLGAVTELYLDSRGGTIFDVSSLASLTSLEVLYLGGNAIADVSPLAGLTSLAVLELSANAISDVSPLAGLTSLDWLDLQFNAISDVSPIVANGGLADGDFVDLRGNPLAEESRRMHVPRLLHRGVDVAFHTEVDGLGEVLDRGLHRAAERALYAFEQERLADLKSLDASDRGIGDLTGIEGAVGLRGLFLDRNRVTDIAPLGDLGSLSALTLAYNMVVDWTPLARMESLQFLALDGNSLTDLPQLPGRLLYLYLTDNSISDISSLADLWLVELQVGGNSVTSLAALAQMSGLRYLYVDDNDVMDLSPLNFDSLRELLLRNNAVHDLSPLLNGEELLLVDVRRNPLADDALAVLDTLRERRITVLAGEMVPYFPAAGDGRQGFVRIVNRSDEGGHVFIEAVDDAGVRAGPVRLDIGAQRAVHFNSADLEYGSAAKGMAGIGGPTAGDWRLAVISALDVEVLSYVRTEDGFVTAMHDVAMDAQVPFFNPGSNERQRSILRVVNTEAEPGKWTTGGYDDGGQWHPMVGSLLVRPQHALTLTAQALENTHGLGDGRGKWRLRVRGFPWFAMSLLESPTGHLTNLSTAPAHTESLADGGTMHRLPLFPAGGGSREGFVRMINRSYTSGEVAIEAVDDAGARFGPVRLRLRPRQTVHFNSADLEGGNPAKGLDSGLGVGTGDWRLEVASELELMVLAYARTPDGFLTSLHDLAPVAEDGSHRVVFFNPGSNTRQVSKLRLINDGERAASVRITGIDDQGGGSETVVLTVSAGSASTFTSAELEAGGDRVAGRLGNGDGKWRLRVRSEERLAVMSLLETPSGHLTNVSTGTVD